MNNNKITVYSFSVKSKQIRDNSSKLFKRLIKKWRSKLCIVVYYLITNKNARM